MLFHKKLLIILTLLLCYSAISCDAEAKEKSGGFGIFTSTLDGKNFREIISDPYREINHARVSPDKKWVTFSRFNKRKLFSKLAEEKNGYTETEIMVASLDGTEMVSLTKPRKNIINVNSYWAPDGRGLVYMSNDNNDKRKLRIKHIDIVSGVITDVSPQEIPWASDPHQVGNTIVFPATMDTSDVRSIWLMNVGSNKATPVTFPDVPKSALSGKPPAGDSDPKISPDGTKVAFTRHFGKGNYHNCVVDLETGEEKDFSSPTTVDVMPEWSSDGKLLIYWHVDMKNIRKIGLYTVDPESNNAPQQVPLPRGYHFKMPAFFPGEGSGKDARIIFTGKVVPGLR
ncbi:MAG: PD40 domain-containing protein [Candidatus Scalindua rubra]|uniref:Protein TolB n=1 Tax=Candidatus Scalindua brodae TaxID=237368 RepID=A0A0B0EJU9_9BACT|nr:MAG: Protein TolB [Candidatus Scalindua brodae]MBZ0109947.1 PD40 domain-containing protein [Candidatus Scalindua rubra]TWU35479.1 translocation protein TolB [Candidatus Brocadiaceae bacterium S225]